MWEELVADPPIRPMGLHQHQYHQNNGRLTRYGCEPLVNSSPEMKRPERLIWGEQDRYHGG